MMTRRHGRSRRAPGARGTVGQPTAPSSLASVLSFFRADTGVTTSGANVTQINDQIASGLVGNMTPFAGSTITKTTQANGKADITFNGGALIGSASIPSSSGYVLFGTMQRNGAPAAEERIWDKNFNTHTADVFVAATGKLGFRVTNNTFATGTTTVTDNAIHYYTAKWAPDVASGLLILRVDGVDQGLVAVEITAMAGSTDRWAAGSSSDNTSTFLDFHGRAGTWGIASHSAASPNPDVAAIEAWLSWYIS
jgi:hypothetical protein